MVWMEHPSTPMAVKTLGFSQGPVQVAFGLLALSAAACHETSGDF